MAIKNVTDEDDLMIINRSGVAIRMAVDSLRIMGRATQGVRLIKVREDDAIAAVAKAMKDEEEVVLGKEQELDTDNGTILDSDDEKLDNQE